MVDPLRLTLPQHVEVTIPGIRIRSEPALDGQLIGTLPLGGTALAMLGPLVIDGYSWYQVWDNSGDPPEYESGWMAVGSASDPWVTESLGWSGMATYQHQLDGNTSGEYGPFELHELSGVQWAAAGENCHFEAEAIGPGGARATIVSTDVEGVVVGRTTPGFFAPTELTGNARLTVTSDCPWTMDVVVYQG